MDRDYETLRIGMQTLFHDLGITRHACRINNILSIGEMQVSSPNAIDRQQRLVSHVRNWPLTWVGGPTTKPAGQRVWRLFEFNRDGVAA